MDIFLYSDASFSKDHSLAVLGYIMILSKAEHEDFEAREDSVIFQVTSELNNIRAELRGAIRALSDCWRFLKNESDSVNAFIKLYTDCQTVSGLLARREKLEANGFISQKKNRELANKDLYSEFYSLCDLLRPEIIWIKGHTVKERRTAVAQNFSFLDKVVRARLREKLQ